MSTAPESADRQQQRATEFMRLLPLTLEIAGLSRTQAGSVHNSEGQMEVRANTIKLAYKIARQLMVEVAGNK